MALEFDYVHILGLHEFTSLDINPRVGPLRNAQRTQTASSFPRLLAPAFAAHAAELTAAFGTATPFGRITWRSRSVAPVTTVSRCRSRNDTRTSIS